MNFWSAKLLLLLALAVPVTQQQSQPSQANPGGTAPSTAAPVNPAPQSPNLRVLTPLAGQQLTTNIVNVRFEVVNPAATGGSPNFLVQLDGGDAITIRDTEYTFTGLGPGLHTVTVTMVDANGTPIPGSRSSVQFAVASPTPRAGALTLPSGNSPLPLLSLVGFGVLIWQAVVAMRSRA